MRYQLITEELVHLLKCSSTCFRIEEEITQRRDNIEDEEDVEIAESNLRKCLWRELCKNEIDRPVCLRKGSEMARDITARTTQTELTKVVMALPKALHSTGKTSAGYTHEIIPVGV